MRLPTRRSQRLKTNTEDDEPIYLTQDGLDKLKHRLKQIEEHDLPQSIEDVRITSEFGDFSENAEYQEAKARMRRLRDQVASINERLKKVIIIQTDGKSADLVGLGTSVVVETQNGDQKTFEIVGPQETDPIHGRLSFKSPLGSILMGRKIGEEVVLRLPAGSVVYKIVEIG